MSVLVVAIGFFSNVAICPNRFVEIPKMKAIMRFLLKGRSACVFLIVQFFFGCVCVGGGNWVVEYYRVVGLLISGIAIAKPVGVLFQ